MNGNLAWSRAIGDFEFKKSHDLPPEQQIVTAFPDVEIHEINDDDEFLVVACDGKSPLNKVLRTTLIRFKVSGTANLRKLLSSLFAEVLPRSKIWIRSVRT